MATSNSDTVRPTRKKTPGACERCREKRVKPCNQCSGKNFECVFTFNSGVGSEMIADKLNLILSRIERIEQSMTRPSLVRNTYSTLDIVHQHPISEMEEDGVAQLNRETGCFEFYGTTSTFMIASSLGKRTEDLESMVEESQFPKRRRIELEEANETQPQARGNLSLGDLTGFCDYVVPANSLRQPRRLRESVTDRHLANFFSTIHILLPVFDEKSLRSKYEGIRTLFGDSRLFQPTAEDPTRPQFVCLLYAVLALGALYEDEREDSSPWASWYFGEAQDMLSRHLDAINLQLVQAAMLMGAYAQHAIKPNLAYILTGLATRLGFSIGINIESVCRSCEFDIEEARRTWWLIYIQEVELSLDSGRPMSLQVSAMQVEYPRTQIRHHSGNDINMQAAFIRCLAKIADVIRRVLELANCHEERVCIETEKLQDKLRSWKASVPSHLRFNETENDFDTESQSLEPYSWQARQQSSLRIHYNLAMMILMRRFLVRSPAANSWAGHTPSISGYQSACLEAARDMIKHIHQLFGIAPGLKRWSYYCFYCLQASLVLLVELTEPSVGSHDTAHPNSVLSESAPLLDHNNRARTGDDDLALCDLAVEIFEQIDLKASKKCAEVVQNFLDKWKKTSRRAYPELRDYLQPSETQSSAQLSQLSQSRKRMTGASVDLDIGEGYPPRSQQPTSASQRKASRVVARPSSAFVPSGVTGATKTSTSLGLAYPEQLAQENRVSGVSGVSGTDASSRSSPPMDISQLQAELDGALHCTDGNYGFVYESQAFRFGGGIGVDGFLNLDGNSGIEDRWYPQTCNEPGSDINNYLR